MNAVDHARVWGSLHKEIQLEKWEAMRGGMHHRTDYLGVLVEFAQKVVRTYEAEAAKEPEGR